MTSVELRARVARRGFELDVDLELPERRTGLFGPSGAGKSTLLHALAGLVPAEELRLVVEGQTLVDSARGLVPPAHRRRVGLVFQDHRLFPHLTVAENLRFGASERNAGADLGEVVELLDVGALMGTRPADLSGGEQQRVAIGRALLAAPRLLLLDEPLASLDRGLVRQILPYLRRVQERFGLPMLVVSHDLGDLLTLTDDLLLLERGRLRGQGTVERLVAEVETLELLHDQGLVFALPGRVERRDPDGLAWVLLEGSPPIEIACGDCREDLGAPVDVLLRPEDVVLARPPLDARLSLTNRFPGRVRHITRGERRSLVTLDCGLGAPLLAEVTDRAVRRLELGPGEPVIALAKAQATRTRGAG